MVGGIGANRNSPGRFFCEHAIIGVQLLEAARRYKIEKTVVLGTICAYPKFTTVVFCEEDLWYGFPEETNAPYGLAKKMLLVQSQVYRQEYGMNFIFLLPVNLYGHSDNFDLQTSHVIPVPVNLGSGVEISIRDLAINMAAITGFRGKIVWNTAQPNGLPRRCLDTSRAEREFGFRAKTPFEADLRKTINWYLATRAKQNKLITSANHCWTSRSV